MAHYVIYIPGLADHKLRLQYRAVALWRVLGVRAEVHRMDWIAARPLSERFTTLLKRIDGLTEQGHRVSLVGVSAGASVALNAYAERRDVIHRVVCLCGKIQNPQTVGAQVYKSNPAFKESMARLAVSLPKLKTTHRRRILSIHPLADNAVPVDDTKLEGAVERTIPTVGHGLSIAYGITLGSFRLLRFLQHS